MKAKEVVAWHHGLNGQESQQTLGDGEGQGRPDVLQFVGSQSRAWPMDSHHNNLSQQVVLCLDTTWLPSNTKGRGSISFPKQ